jgi:dihydrofolate synthase/folylpolyglutamate synthase
VAGRLQVFRRPDGQTFLLDGAHNPAGAEALAEALKQNFAGAKPTLIVGTLRDKNWRSILMRLAPLTDKLLLAPVGSERSAVPRELASVGRETNPRAAVFVCATLSEALGRAAADPFVVITGSLYLVGEALAALQISDCADTSERGLNDWTQAAAVKTAQTEALG